MQINFVFDTEKDDARSIIKMLESFIEGSVSSNSPVIKETKSATVTTRKVDRRYKLSFNEVQEIRKACENGASNKELGKKYGVSPSNISLIRHNKGRLHY